MAVEPVASMAAGAPAVPVKRGTLADSTCALLVGVLFVEHPEHGASLGDVQPKGAGPTDVLKREDFGRPWATSVLKVGDEAGVAVLALCGPPGDLGGLAVPVGNFLAFRIAGCNDPRVDVAPAGPVSDSDVEVRLDVSGGHKGGEDGSRSEEHGDGAGDDKTMRLRGRCYWGAGVC